MADSPVGQAVRSRKALREERHALRRRQCLELRKAGATFTRIGEALGISDEGARKLYRSALKDFYREPAEEERELALLRCDGLLERWWPDMLQREDPKLAAIASREIRFAMAFQAEIWGYRRPKADVEINLNQFNLPTDSEAWATLEAIRRAAAENAEVIDVTLTELPPAESNGHAP